MHHQQLTATRSSEFLVSTPYSVHAQGRKLSDGSSRFLRPLFTLHPATGEALLGAVAPRLLEAVPVMVVRAALLREGSRDLFSQLLISRGVHVERVRLPLARTVTGPNISCFVSTLRTLYAHSQSCRPFTPSVQKRTYITGDIRSAVESRWKEKPVAEQTRPDHPCESPHRF
jgi:hypothetical protein